MFPCTPFGFNTTGKTQLENWLKTFIFNSQNGHFWQQIRIMRHFSSVNNLTCQYYITLAQISKFIWRNFILNIYLQSTQFQHRNCQLNIFLNGTSSYQHIVSAIPDKYKKLSIPLFTFCVVKLYFKWLQWLFRISV